MEAEDRWRRALEEHDADPLAHSPQRHEFINATLGPIQLALELRLQKIEGQLQKDAVDRAELRGILRVLRWELAGLGALLVAIASAAAYKVFA